MKQKRKWLLVPLLLLFVACGNPAGKYVCEKGTITIHKDKTWSAKVYHRDYPMEYEGKLDFHTLVITKGYYQGSGGNPSFVFGELHGNKIEHHGYIYTKQ